MAQPNFSVDREKYNSDPEYRDFVDRGGRYVPKDEGFFSGLKQGILKFGAQFKPEFGAAQSTGMASLVSPEAKRAAMQQQERVTQEYANRRPYSLKENPLAAAGEFAGQMVAEAPFYSVLGGPLGGLGRKTIGKIVGEAAEATTRRGAFGRAALASLPGNIAGGVAGEAVLRPESVATPGAAARTAAYSALGGLFEGAGAALRMKPKSALGAALDEASAATPIPAEASAAAPTVSASRRRAVSRETMEPPPVEPTPAAQETLALKTKKMSAAREESLWRLAETGEESALHPDGTPKITIDEFEDPDFLAKNTRKSLPKNLQSLTDRELDIELAARMKKYGEMQGVLMEKSLLDDLQESNNTGRSMGRKMDPRLSYKELRALGAFDSQATEEFLARLAERNMSWQDYKRIRLEGGRYERSLPKLNREIAALSEEAARRSARFEPEVRGAETLAPGEKAKEAYGESASEQLGPMSPADVELEELALRRAESEPEIGISSEELAQAFPDIPTAYSETRRLKQEPSASVPSREEVLSTIESPAFQERTLPQATPRTTPIPGDRYIDADDYININRFSDDPDVQQRLRRAAQEVIEEVNIPLRATAEDVAAGRARKKGALLEQESLESVRNRVARDLGIDPAEIVGRAQNGKPLDRFDLLAVRTALNDVMAEETQLLQEMRAEGVPKEALVEMGARLRRVIDERNSLFETFSIGRTQQGRDLNALKIASMRTFDPTAWTLHVQKYAQRPLSEAEVAEIWKAANLKDRDELMKIANSVRKTSLAEKFSAYVQAGLLLAPKTHFANLAGNTGLALLESAKDVPANFVDALISTVTKQRTKSFDSGDMARASINGAVSGARDFMAVLRGQKAPTQRLSDIPREIRFNNPLLQAYTNGPFRLLSASDQVFKSIAIFRSIDEQARVMARAEGLSGDALRSRVAELTKNPTDLMSGRALADAEIATFQDDTALSRGAIAIRNAVNKVTGGVGGNLLFPFAKTPANIAQRVLDYSPLNLAYQFVKVSDLLLPKNRGNAVAQKRIVEQIGRSSIGTGAIALGYFAAMNGRASGFFPTNQRQRDEWEQQGKMEGAIKFSDDGPWVQAAKYSPVGNLIQIGAAMYESAVDPQQGMFDFALAGVTSPFRTVVELPMVANVNSAIELARAAGTGRAASEAGTIIGRTATAIVPGTSILRPIAGSIDRTVRETRGLGALETALNQAQSIVPFASRGLPAKVDPLGAERQREFGLVGQLMSPSNISRDLTKESAVRAELKRTGAVVGRIEREGKESGEQFANRERVTGQLIERVLGAVMQSPEYRNIARINPAAARQVLRSYLDTERPDLDVDLDKISDERIIARLQGAMLESEAQKVKSAIARARTQSGLSSVRRQMGAIIR